MRPTQDRESYWNYPYLAAGRVWSLPRIAFKVGPKGDISLDEAELRQANLAVANEICGTPEPLSGEELEFLCSLTGTSFTEVAARLSTSKSNITFWRKPKRSLPLLDSLSLKKWFWRKLFGAELAARVDSGFAPPLEALFDDRSFLPHLRDFAVTAALAPSLRQGGAPAEAEP